VLRTLSLILALAAGSPTWAAEPHPLAAPLAAAADSARQARRIQLELDDLHPLYGGDRYVLEGRVLTHTHQPRGGKPPVETRVTLSSPQLQELAALLHAQALWEQRVPEDKPRPDESRTTLTLTLDGATSTIWERHNDLVANDRLVRVRGLLASWASPS